MLLGTSTYVGGPTHFWNQNWGRAAGTHRTSSSAFQSLLGVPNRRIPPARSPLWGPKLFAKHVHSTSRGDQDRQPSH